jgi:hypothetical protein
VIDASVPGAAVFEKARLSLYPDQQLLVDRATRRAAETAAASSVDGSFRELARATHDSNGHPWSASIVTDGSKMYYLSDYQQISEKAALLLQEREALLAARAARVRRTTSPSPSPSPSPGLSKPTESHAASVAAARALQSTYRGNCQMPEQALKLLENGELQALSAKCFVLSHQGLALPEEVKTLATQRVPANIAGHDYFDPEALQRHFGWKRAYYDQYYADKGVLAPQLAVFCRTPCFDGHDRRTWRTINVVNLIGLALDSSKQSDQRFLGRLEKNQARDYALLHMRRMWCLMFEAAGVARLRRVEYTRVSGGAFSANLKALTGWDYDELLKESMPTEPPSWSGVVSVQAFEGWVPTSLLRRRQEDLDEVLLVNAWDPLTIIGNGNAMDHSIDGFFGRSTAMGVLGWPLSNPQLRFLQVPSSMCLMP